MTLGDPTGGAETGAMRKSGGEFRRRKGEDEGAAAAGPRLERERAALRLGQAARDREPQSGAAHVRRAVRAPVERLKDPLALVVRHPRAAVGHAEDEPVALARGGEVDGGARRRVLVGVL